ncbi:hypothetical protein HPB52_003666 [Rhipicephalus sanguineus]|uniref:SH3 domain-containing protein n=1 Tax=Rhipicephalus sanguineus TaxID=34632 RepID=A0A9D4Q8W5_RHISA|nr:hypothetical protein HPB52_003666 [Rhipicephalus sanguineus]
MTLLNRTNSDWWNVRQMDGEEGFVPANYVREVEPRIVQKTTKKPVKVAERHRVKKVVMKQQPVKVKKEKQLSPQKSPKQNGSSPKDGKGVQQRQESIEASYQNLLSVSKEKMLTVEDPKENVEVRKKKFENFLTDMSASKLRMDEIDRQVGEFVQNKHSQLDAIRSRSRQIHSRWDRLNQLKTQKERSLEGATSVELFHRTCDDARDWMAEKLQKIDIDEVGRDMKTVQALQRRHENLERELAPVEEKFNRVNLLADSVKAAYPTERTNVVKRQGELQGLWDQVKDRAAERRSRLEDSMGLQILANSAKSLLAWVSEVKVALNSFEPARDVATAEDNLKKHHDLGDDIRNHEDEFADIQALGEKLLLKNKDNEEMKATLKQLQDEQNVILRGWQEKLDYLRQAVDLQMFNREADQIDSITSSHDALLDFEDLGTTLDDVEALSKRHENLINTLLVQDQRVAAFSGMADKLIAAGHCKSKEIDKRRNQVVANRQAVKDKAYKRKELLEESRVYHEFKAESAEMSSWIQDKLKMAADDSYRDLTNLERKLQKHEAFEAELKANEARLHDINANGRSLIAGKHYASDDIRSVLDYLDEQWQELCRRTNERGQCLRQASAQRAHNRALEDARVKLDELEAALASRDLGHDLRSVKELLKRHQVLEAELTTWEAKVLDLVQFGKAMADKGHFDAPNILKATRIISDRFGQLREPAEERRKQLEESLKLHQFNFDVDTEKQWITEHLSAASSLDLGQNLIDAQNLFKKHQKLEREVQGHQAMVDKTLAAGDALVKQRHFAAASVKDKCHELVACWNLLLSECSKRRKKLELQLKAQTFYSEVNEIEAWMNEKKSVLTSTDFGRDEDAAVKLLTKQKALELEIDTYSGLVVEITHQGQAMIDQNHPDSKIIANQMQTVNQEIKNLQKLSTVRRQKLMEAKHTHEFFRESDDLQDWINEQTQAALSEDYGKDYEHLLLLQAKFEDLKLVVDTGKDRLDQCVALGQRLIAADVARSGEIEKCLEHLDFLNPVWKPKQSAHSGFSFPTPFRDFLFFKIYADLGKDLQATQSLVRRQEGFENDLVALEAQLQASQQDLIVRLQAAYPGGNAEHIAEQQQLVVDQWAALQEKVAQRKDQLKESLQLQKFLSMVRDLETWARGLCSELAAKETVRSATGAQTLKSEHDQVMAEIEAREESFSDVLKFGKMMMDEQHYATAEAKRLSQLLQARDDLHLAWQHKKVYLDQLLDLHFFLRDAKQLDTLSAQQEVYLSGTEVGTTVEEVDANVKKHEAFEKLMATQDEKLQTLEQCGAKLVQQNHFESGTIRKRMEEVAARRAHVKQLSAAKRQKLAEGLLLAQFRRDAAEAEAWVASRHKQLEAQETALSADTPVKQLQKHQAFQAELAAHEGNIAAIKQKGELLLSKKHPASGEVREQLSRLLHLWEELLDALHRRGRGLEEAQDMLDFESQVDKVEAWIRDKELMVQAGDTGEDYEHCQALQRKLDDVDSDMRVDDSRIKNINALADKLIQEGRPNTRAVQQRREKLNRKWKALQGALEAYRARLAAALEVHAFKRDIDDTVDRINEKAIVMTTKEESKSLRAVESLQRRQDAVEREMTTIDAKLKDHEQDCERLMKKHGELASPIRAKVVEVQENWKRLMGLCNNRRVNRFLYTLNEAWVNDLIERMNSGGLGTNMQEAESLLEFHQECKFFDVCGGNSDLRSTTYLSAASRRSANAVDTKFFADELSRTQHWSTPLLAPQTRPATRPNAARSATPLTTHRFTALLTTKMEVVQVEGEEISPTELRKENGWLDVCAKCKERKTLVEGTDPVEQTVDTLASEETYIRRAARNIKKPNLPADDIKIIVRPRDGFCTATHRAARIGDSIRNAAGLTQEETRATGNGDKDGLPKAFKVSWAQKAASGAHMRFGTATTNSEGENDIIMQIQKRLEQLESDNTRYINVIKELREENAKLKDEAEMEGRQDAFERLHSFGNMLLRDKHPASDVVDKELERLEQLRQSLRRAWEERAAILRQCKDLQVFREQAKQAEAWLSSKEAVLNNEDLGDSMSSVDVLTKKHAHFEQTMETQGERISHMEEFARALVQDGHYDSAAIQAQCDAICARRKRLQETAQLKRRRLAESRQFQRFLRNVYEVEAWLNEKLQVACDENYRDPVNLPSKTKKHAAFEAEILAHRGRVETLLNEGQRLVEADHYASDQIESRLEAVERLWAQLLEQTKLKKDRLQDSYQALLFNWMLDDLQTWMDDVEVQLQSEDHGKDLTSVQNLLKKQQLLETDITNHAEMLEQVKDQAAIFQKNEHFLRNDIQERADAIVKRYTSLHEPLQIRRENLEEALQLQQLLRDVDDEMSWIREKEPLANSADLGTSLSSVQSLQKKHQARQSDIQAHEPLVASVGSKGRQMIRSGHFAASEVEKRLTELQLAWGRLKDAASVRRLRLLDALESHTFYSEATEAEAWMEEKFLVVNSPDLGKDEDSVLALTKKLDGVDRDVDGFNANITRLMKQSTELVDRGHFDSANISAKMKDLEELYTRLKKQIAERRWKLSESAKFYTFLRETDEVLHWIQTQTAIAGSEDYGTDLERVEILMQKFDVFLTTLQGSEDRVRLVQQLGRTLIAERHPQSEAVAKRCTEVAKLWEECKECAASRQDALAGARQVHTFDRNADETISWIYEKEAVLLNEDFGHDLESIQALSRRHEGFQQQRRTAPRLPIHRVPRCFVLRFSSSGFAVYSNGTDCSFVFAHDDELPSADVAFDDLRAGGVLIPAEINLEGFADADKDLELCAELTDDEIIHQVTEDSDDIENEEPAPTQPTNTELTRALMTLSLVYSGNMTLTEIEADIIAGKRTVQKKISDFFAPKC